MSEGGYTQTTPIGLVVNGSLISSIHSTNAGDEEVGFGAFTVNSGTASGSFVVSGSGIGNVSASLKPSAPLRGIERSFASLCTGSGQCTSRPRSLDGTRSAWR